MEDNIKVISLVEDDGFFVKTEPIEETKIEIIETSSDSQNIFKCSASGCSYTTTIKENLNRHNQWCKPLIPILTNSDNVS